MIATSKIFSLGFLFLGMFLLMQVVLPIVSFQLWELGQKIENSADFVSPQSGGGRVVLGISIEKNVFVEEKDNFPAFISKNIRQTIPSYSRFSISIPKLRIDNLSVEVDSNDLSSGLVQLPGSGLPGEKGNVFISGHSALNPLFGLKKAAFARLQDLKKGDRIILEAEGTQFIYEVEALKVVDPKDLSVINPPDKMGRYVSLMTCVPPGLNFKRLIVLGKII